MEHLDTRGVSSRVVKVPVTIRELLAYYRDVWNEWKYFVGMDLPVVRNYKLGRLWEGESNEPGTERGTSGVRGDEKRYPGFL